MDISSLCRFCMMHVESTRRPAVAGTSSTGRVYNLGVGYFRRCEIVAGFVSGMAVGTTIGTFVASLPRTLVGMAVSATYGTAVGVLFRSTLGYVGRMKEDARARRRETPGPDAVDNGGYADRVIISPHLGGGGSSVRSRSPTPSEAGVLDNRSVVSPGVVDRTGSMERAENASDGEGIGTRIPGEPADLEVVGMRDDEQVIGPDVADEKGFTELMRSVLEEDVSEVINLLDKRNADPAITNPQDDEMTSFLYACKGGYRTIALLLYEAHHPSEADMSRALMLAIENGHESVVIWLVASCKVTPSERNGRGENALMLASAKGYCGIVRFLLEEGVAVDEVNRKQDDATALVYACAKGHILVAQLLQTRSQPGCRAKAFRYAARNGHTEIMEWLGDCYGFELLQETGEDVLNLSSVQGRVKVVQFLLSKNIALEDGDRGLGGRVAFLGARREGHTEVVRILHAHNPRLAEITHPKTGETALMIVAGKGHVEILQWLLESCKVDPFRKDMRGGTALTYAARRGHTHVIEELFTHMEDPAGAIRLEDGEGLTPFMHAAHGGHTEVIRLFLKTDLALKGPDQRSDDGWSPLMIAVRERHADTAELLMDFGSSPNDSDPRFPEVTALAVAARNGHVEIVELLIRRGADVNPTSFPGKDSPIISAAANGCTDVVRLLNDHGADITRTGRFGRTARERAATNRRNDVLQLIDELLTLHADKATESETSRVGMSELLFAAANGRVEAVERLIAPSSGTDVTQSDEEGRTALMLAACKGYRDIVVLLIEYGHGILLLRRSYTGQTALTYAISERHEEVAQLLLSKIIGMRASHTLCYADASGMTPLTLAIGKSVTVFQRLLDVFPKERLSCRNKAGQTACMLAASSPDFLQRLLRIGVSKDDINATLVLAAGGGCVDSVQLLAEHWADVDHVDSDGNTPTILAASKGHLSVVQWLVATAQADPNLRNKSGQTARDVAQKNSRDYVVRWLDRASRPKDPPKE